MIARSFTVGEPLPLTFGQAIEEQGAFERRGLAWHRYSAAEREFQQARARGADEAELARLGNAARLLYEVALRL